MWTLRFYNPTNDELRGEVPLPELDDDEARRLLGFVPHRGGSTPLGREGTAAFEQRFRFSVLDDLVGFLDFDAPAEAPTEAEPARRRWGVVATS
jgi:hypothetical protein